MRQSIHVVLGAGLLASVLSLPLVLGGCLSVASALPGATNLTGEAWYTEGKGFAGWYFSSSVYYCPPPTGPGPVQCKEAQMVALPKEGDKASSGKAKGTTAPPPAKSDEE